MNTISKEFDQALACIDIKKISNDWEEKVKDVFEQYLKIPNISPSYDKQWKENQHIDSVVKLFVEWITSQLFEGTKVFVQEIQSRTPLIIIDVPAVGYEADDTILMYGHLDKQPAMEGWQENIKPFDATYVGNRLYGRGSADDGYALFSAMLSLKQLYDNQLSHARTIIIIEASEESGSPDLSAHLEIIDSTLETPIENVSLVICLDSGCLDYERLWITQSLRGLLQVNVSVRVLNEGVHSGAAGGIVPSATHIFRSLLDRISKPGSGEIILPELYEPISDKIYAAASSTGQVLNIHDNQELPFAAGVQPLVDSMDEQLINQTYMPSLEIIGIEGIPVIQDAGNVLRPVVTFALSFRLPPNVDPYICASAVKQELLRDIPYRAHVDVEIESLANGWDAPMLVDWLQSSLSSVSNKFFDTDVLFMGEGGTIPFMSMLSEQYPDAQFMVTGVLGPHSNAHGPNEFLDLNYMYKVTACVSGIISAHGLRNKIAI